MSLSHILILAIIVIVLLRPKRITELFSAFGKAIKNYKDTQNEIVIEAEDIIEVKDSTKNSKVDQ